MNKFTTQAIALATFALLALPVAVSAQDAGGVAAETIPSARAPSPEREARQDTARSQRDARLATMSTEDRAAAEARRNERRTKFESMTPEQRQTKMQEFRANRPDNGGARPQRQDGRRGN